METKRALRRRLRAARALRTPTDLDRAATAIARLGLEAWRQTPVVAAYVSVRTEPPTGPLLDALVAAGVTVLLPVVRPAGLDWGRYEGRASLVEARGLLEPAGPPLGPRALDGADVVLVPALAVDRHGHRIGQGGGYYDRALAGRPASGLVAVVFDEEIVDEVPVESHDVPVGAALTPSALAELGG